MAFFFKRKNKHTDKEEAGLTEQSEAEAPVPETVPGFKSETQSEAAPAAEEPASSEETGLFKRLSRGLSKTRSNISGRMGRLLLGKKEITQDLLDELEEILFTSDIGVATTQELIAYLRNSQRFP